MIEHSGLPGILTAMLVAALSAATAAEGTDLDALFAQLVAPDPVASGQAASALQAQEPWEVAHAGYRHPPSTARDAALVRAWTTVLVGAEQPPSYRATAALALSCLGPEARAARSTLLDVAIDPAAPARVRGEALACLASLGPEGEAALLDLLDSDDPGVANMATGVLVANASPERLARLQALSGVLAQARSVSPTLRLSAYASALAGGERRERAIAEFINGLGSSGLTDRWFSLEVLRVLGPDARDAVPAVMTLLESNPHAHRMLAHSTLEAIGPPARAAVPRLERELEEAVGYSQVPIAAALVSIAPDHVAGRAALTRVTRDPEGWSLSSATAQHSTAMAALEEHGTPTTARIARRIAELGDQAEGILSYLQEILFSCGIEGMEELADVLDERDPRTRSLELGELSQKYPPFRAQMRGSQADPDVQHLTQSLGSWHGQPSADFRRLPTAVALLQRDPANGAAIVFLLRSQQGEFDLPNRGIAVDMARSALPAAGGQSVRALLAALQDESPLVRAGALSGLQQLGPEAVDVIPALREIRLHGGSAIARRMIAVLRDVGPPATEIIPDLMDALPRQLWGLGDLEPRIVHWLQSRADPAPEAIPRLVEIIRAAQPANDAARSALRDDLSRLREVSNTAHRALRAIGPSAGLSAAELVQALEQHEIPFSTVLLELMQRGEKGRALVPGLLLAQAAAGRDWRQPIPAGEEVASGGREVIEVVLKLMDEQRRTRNRQRPRGTRPPLHVPPVFVDVLGLFETEATLHQLQSIASADNRLGFQAVLAMDAIAPHHPATTAVVLDWLLEAQPGMRSAALVFLKVSDLAGRDPQVCNVLLDLFLDGTLDARATPSVVRALERAGPCAHAAAPALVELLQHLPHRQAQLRDAVLSCLRSIERR